MPLTSALLSTTHSFRPSASVLVPPMVAPALGTTAVVSPSSTSTSTVIINGSIGPGFGKSGSSSSSTVQSSMSTGTLSSAPQASTSTHATNMQTPTLLHSVDISSQASTAAGHQGGTTSLSSPFLISKSFPGSSLISTVSPSLPTITPGPSSDARETHELVIDLGNCGGIGTPMVIDDKGNRPELTSLGGGRFTMTIGEQIYTDTKYMTVFILDDGSRCVQPADCLAIAIHFNMGAGMRMRISSVAEKMYPLSIWMDDAVTLDGRPAHSSETASHCWGWTEEECPNSYDGIKQPLWTISSESPTARAFVTFCPPNGPDLSKVGRNPNPLVGPPRTWGISQTRISVPVSTFLSAHRVGEDATASTAQSAGFQSNIHPGLPPGCSFISTCFADSTYISMNQVSTISTVLIRPTLTTHIGSDATTTILLPTSVAEPGNQALTSWVVRSTDPIRSTVQSRWMFATLSPGLAIQPSSTPSTQDVPPNGRVTADSLSSQNYIVTSWTTWMEVNGLTVLAIAGQVAIETTVPVTYALESDTIIPVDVFRSLSMDSMRTASSSPTSAAARGESSLTKRGTIAAAVVGTLVGLGLGIMLVWFACCRMQRARSRDYLAQGSLRWGRGRKGRFLDLDGGAREREVDREMVVEPWAPPVSVARRKRCEHSSAHADGDAEVVECGVAVSNQEQELGLTESGPIPSQSHFPPSSERHIPTAGTQARKSAPQGPSQSRLRPQHQHQSLSPLNSQRSQHFRPDQEQSRSPPIANPSDTPLPAPFEHAPHAAAPAPQTGVERHNAIPPLYNEAWKAAR